MIDTLPPLAPNPDRSARVVARCRATLEQRRNAREAAERLKQRRAVLVERAIGAAFCLAYAAAVVLNALRFLARA